jgi:hypothetical protein
MDLIWPNIIKHWTGFNVIALLSQQMARLAGNTSSCKGATYYVDPKVGGAYRRKLATNMSIQSNAECRQSCSPTILSVNLNGHVFVNAMHTVQVFGMFSLQSYRAHNVSIA